MSPLPEDSIALEFVGFVKQLFGLESEPDCQVRLNLDTRAIEVNCPTTEVLERIIQKRRRNIARPAQKMDVPTVNLRLRGEIELTFPPQLVLQFAGTTMNQILTTLPQQGGLLAIPDRQTIDQLVGADPDLKIIKWNGSVGLASGRNCQQSSGLSPEMWKGRSMDVELPGGNRTWIPEEWQRFQTALFEHLNITDFGYRAHLYTGELVEMVVDAWLGTYNSALIRAVHVKSCTVI